MLNMKFNRSYEKMNDLKTILVTGGAGYVGTVLVPKLLNAGYRVKVLDLYIYGEDVLRDVKDNSNLIEIKGDIRDKKIISNTIPGCDAVIHLACISNDPSYELDPALGKSINYDAFIPLVDISKASGGMRLLTASSFSPRLPQTSARCLRAGPARRWPLPLGERPRPRIAGRSRFLDIRRDQRLGGHLGGLALLGFQGLIAIRDAVWLRDVLGWLRGHHPHRPQLLLLALSGRNRSHHFLACSQPRVSQQPGLGHSDPYLVQ